MQKCGCENGEMSCPLYHRNPEEKICSSKVHIMITDRDFDTQYRIALTIGRQLVPITNLNF